MPWVRVVAPLIFAGKRYDPLRLVWVLGICDSFVKVAHRQEGSFRKLGRTSLLVTHLATHDDGDVGPWLFIFVARIAVFIVIFRA